MNNDQLITNYYITHRDELLTYVSTRLGGRAEAEDVVQNVFLRLLTSTKLITETTLPALAYTTARHMICDFSETIRWWSRNPKYTPDEICSFFLENTPIPE